MSEIDWSKIETASDISEKELARLNSPSGNKCPGCNKETTTGEDEAFGACYDCYAG